MKNDTQDNEPLSFIRLAAATANVIRWLEPHEKKNEEAGGDPKPGDGSEKDSEEQRRYIEHRLREIAAWERKISGRKI